METLVFKIEEFYLYNKKMNKVKYNIVLFLLLISSLSNAQSIMQMNLDEFYKQFNTKEYGHKIVGESVVGGSPYEKAEFIPGMVVTKTGVHYIGIPLRYNIYSDEVEYKFRDRGVFVFERPEIIDSVYIGHEKFVYGSYSTGKKLSNRARSNLLVRLGNNAGVTVRE